MALGASRPRILRKDFLYDAYDAFRERGFVSMVRGSLNHLAFLLTFNYGGSLIGYGANTLTREELRQRGEQRGRIWYLEEPEADHITDLLKKGHHPVTRETESILNEIQYRKAKPREFDQPFVTELAGGMIVGCIPIALTSRGEIIVDSFDYQHEVMWPQGAALGQILWNDGFKIVIDALFRTDTFRQSISPENHYESLVLMDNDWARNYSHWTFEHLPKLRAVEHYREQTRIDPTLVVEPDPPEYKREMLKLMGYDESDWIALPDNRLVADKLVMPSYPVPNREELVWVRDRIQSNVPESVDVETPDRILLLRPERIRRQLVNREEVEELLSKYGFTSIAPETMSVAEQATFFSEANVIVGAHGSALTNTLWTEGATVVELFTDRMELGLYMLAEVLGHEYEYMLCDTVEGRHLRIDIDELETTVQRIIDET